jgi:hypothetical protein
MTLTHLFAEMSKAVPPLQAVHDLSEPESVTSDLHETHFAAAASQAIAPLQAVAEVKSALAVVALIPTAAASIDAARRNLLMTNSPLVILCVRPDGPRLTLFARTLVVNGE